MVNYIYVCMRWCVSAGYGAGERGWVCGGSGNGSCSGCCSSGGLKCSGGISNRSIRCNGRGGLVPVEKMLVVVVAEVAAVVVVVSSNLVMTERG